MQKERKYCLILCGLLLCASVGHGLLAQGIGSSSSFLPDTIVDETDRIFYNFFIVTTSSGCFLNTYSVESSADSIFIRSCTHKGQLGSPCFTNDTILIAENLMAGTYHVSHFAATVSSAFLEDTLCMDPRASIFRDTAYYELLVRKRTSVESPTLTPLRVFPNPAHSRIQFSATWPNRLPDEVRIYDGRGRLSRQAAWQESLDIWALATGVYWVQVFSEGKMVGYEKFVISR
ncbi:MAG: T9SS type A sorting domain-containing protein [Bacteroidota bacterium]